MELLDPDSLDWLFQIAYLVLVDSFTVPVVRPRQTHFTCVGRRSRISEMMLLLERSGT